MNRIVMYALLLAALPCSAQVQSDEQAYRCVSKSGAVRYQPEPCSKGQTPTRLYQVQDDEISQARRERARYELQERLQAGQDLSRAAGTDVRPRYSGPSNYQRRQSKCESAKADRERYLKLNPNAGYDARVRWNDLVWEACK